MATVWSDKPYPAGVAVEGSASFTRTYVDGIGRPLSGKVTFTASAWTDFAGVSIAPSPVTVELAPDGLVAVQLPLGTYAVAERLLAFSGLAVNREWMVTLTEGSYSLPGSANQVAVNNGDGTLTFTTT